MAKKKNKNANIVLRCNTIIELLLQAKTNLNEIDLPGDTGAYYRSRISGWINNAILYTDAMRDKAQEIEYWCNPK